LSRIADANRIKHWVEGLESGAPVVRVRKPRLG
jgi:hypothetical protein